MANELGKKVINNIKVIRMANELEEIINNIKAS